MVTLRRAPPTLFLPVELHGRPVCMVTMLALAAPGAAEALAPLRETGQPLLDLVKRRPYTGLQSMFDQTVPEGWHYYTKSAGLNVLDTYVLDTLIEHAARSGSLWSHAQLYHTGGAVADVDPETTAYSRRDVPHELVVTAALAAASPTRRARNGVGTGNRGRPGTTPLGRITELPRPRRPPPHARGLRAYRLPPSNRAAATVRPARRVPAPALIRRGHSGRRPVRVAPSDRAGSRMARPARGSAPAGLAVSLSWHLVQAKPFSDIRFP